MNRLPRVFSYKLTRNYGFAPNPSYGICTLARCKPQSSAGLRLAILS
ncbi:hypothetical protein [Pseudomonas chlororaphis]